MTITRIARRGATPPKPSEAPPALPPAASPQRPAATEAGQPAAAGGPGLITPAAAAGRLGVNAKVLERWRGSGDGPAFVRMSSKTIRYRPEDLEAFVAGRVRTSTAA